MAAATLLPPHTSSGYVLIEERQKRESDEDPSRAIEISIVPPQISIDSTNLKAVLGILRQNCEKATRLILKQAKQIRDFDESLVHPPELSCFYWCFCSRKHKSQEQARSDFIQKHLEQYAALHRGYTAAISPQLAAQISAVEKVIKARQFFRLHRILDQTTITSHKNQEPSLNKLTKDLLKIRKNELDPLISELYPILNSITSIVSLAKCMFKRVTSINIRLNALCKTNHAIQLDKNREYRFVPFRSSTTGLSSKSFQHLHQALNELDDEPIEAPPESIEITIPESLETLLEPSFTSLRKRTLELQSQIFEAWITTAAPENSSCGWMAIDRDGSHEIVIFDGQ